MLKRFQTDLKKAMLAREKLRVNTLRMILAAIKNMEIELRRELNEEEYLKLLTTQAKRRREAAEAFHKGGRIELAQQEEAELLIVQSYLPSQLSSDEVRSLAQAVIASIQPQSAKDFGRVMGQVMGKIKGRFDGKSASAIIREEFNKALESS